MNDFFNSDFIKSSINHFVTILNERKKSLLSSDKLNKKVKKKNKWFLTYKRSANLV